MNNKKKQYLQICCSGAQDGHLDFHTAPELSQRSNKWNVSHTLCTFCFALFCLFAVLVAVFGSNKWIPTLPRKYNQVINHRKRSNSLPTQLQNSTKSKLIRDCLAGKLFDYPPPPAPPRLLPLSPPHPNPGP